MSNASILDIISPVMVGPSSSHTAGAVRIGLLAKNIYEKEINNVKITLYNSYAQTGLGHGTDKGIIAGLLGYQVDNTIIKNIFETKEASKLDYHFEYEQSFSKHPNAVDFDFNNNEMTISAQSIGGGEVRVTKINNFDVNLDGKLNTIIIVTDDEIGMLSKITHIIQKNKINIANLSSDRKSRGQNASFCISLDTEISERALMEIELETSPKLIRYIKKLQS